MRVQLHCASAVHPETTLAMICVDGTIRPRKRIIKLVLAPQLQAADVEGVTSHKVICDYDVVRQQALVWPRIHRRESREHRHAHGNATEAHHARAKLAAVKVNPRRKHGGGSVR